MSVIPKCSWVTLTVCDQSLQQATCSLSISTLLTAAQVTKQMESWNISVHHGPLLRFTILRGSNRAELSLIPPRLASVPVSAKARYVRPSRNECTSWRMSLKYVALAKFHVLPDFADVLRWYSGSRLNASNTRFCTYTSSGSMLGTSASSIRCSFSSHAPLCTCHRSDLAAFRTNLGGKTKS